MHKDSSFPFLQFHFVSSRAPIPRRESLLPSPHLFPFRITYDCILYLPLRGAASSFCFLNISANEGFGVVLLDDAPHAPPPPPLLPLAFAGVDFVETGAGAKAVGFAGAGVGVEAGACACVCTCAGAGAGECRATGATALAPVPAPATAATRVAG